MYFKQILLDMYEEHEDICVVAPKGPCSYRVNTWALK